MIIKTGKITGESYHNWNIQIDNDSHGETGGYYLLISNENKGYDYWFEKFDDLENQLKEFSIEWN